MRTLSVSICAQFALSTTPAWLATLVTPSHFVMTIPAAADPGWTLELGRDGGSRRDGSLYCPKTRDSLNAQRVQFPYWSGDLETTPGCSITHLTRLIKLPVICPVCLEPCLQHAVCYPGHRTQPCHCCCFSLFNLFLVFSREPRPRTGDTGTVKVGTKTNLNIVT